MRPTTRLGIALALLPVLPATASPAETAVKLAELLPRMSRVAELYRDNALRFTCDETIYCHSNWGRRDHKFRYIYVYDDKGFDDYRVPRVRGEKRQARQDAVTLDDYALPQFLKRAYSWAFIFGADRRGLFEYELLGAETALGRRAIKVGFAAVPPFVKGVNEWFGTAWIDRETFQLLRVEAYQASEYGNKLVYQRMLERVPAMEDEDFTLTHFERIDTEFGVVKNGMRFPSKVVIERRRYRVPGTLRGERIYMVRQLYRNYRFFGVRTREQIGAATTAGN